MSYPLEDFIRCECCHTAGKNLERPCPYCGGNRQTGEPAPNMPRGATFEQAREDLASGRRGVRTTTRGGNP